MSRGGVERWCRAVVSRGGVERWCREKDPELHGELAKGKCRKNGRKCV
jgi:hypothetical protein